MYVCKVTIRLDKTVHFMLISQQLAVAIWSNHVICFAKEKIHWNISHVICQNVSKDLSR